MQFLMGLNDSYNAVRGQLLLMKPLPNVREAYNFVTQEEKQREIGNNSIAENFSIAAVRNFKNSNNKFSGNSFSHSSSNSNNEGLFCRYCKKDTHKIETCFKLHGYPPGHPRHDPNFKSKARQSNQGNNHRQGQHMDQSSHHAFHATHATANATTKAAGSQFTNGYNHHGSTSILSSPGSINTSGSHPFQAIIPGLSTEQYNQLTTAMANMAHLPKGNIDACANAAGLYNYPSVHSIFSDCWILDSGATDHITSDSSLFVHSHPSTIPSVHLPTGSSIPIDSTGTILFNKDIILKDVLHVPSFRLNLLSASKITQSLHCCVILFPDFCALQDLATGKMIGWGKQSGGLYFMSPVLKSSTVCHTTTSGAIWHHRLGHPSYACMRVVSKSVSSIRPSFDNNCEICPLAK
ncbi:unnamed protein product, partial [Prunus brigantina]